MLRTWWQGLRRTHGPMAAWNAMLWGTLFACASMARLPLACSSPRGHLPLQDPPSRLLGAALWPREECPRRFDTEDTLWQRSCAAVCVP